MAAKQRRSEITVERLLTAALKVWAAGGGQGLSVQAVTEVSGVSQGSLYHHFGSLDGLAAALYTRCTAEMFDEILDRLRHARTAREGVHAIVRGYLGFTGQRPDAAWFIHASAYAGYLAAHAEQIWAAKQEKLEAVAAWLRPRVAAGEIAAIPEPLMEMLLIGPVAETARRWLSRVPGIDLDEAAQVLPDRIWRSVRPDPPPPTADHTPEESPAPPPAQEPR
ncbi:TetR/AcrR family transcriptional regulator [Nonomuraea lactucae]|uniref:TetR/AcrR family transcriptional regulator n=1 Tax=Nonomuraea lactucae TaxID=2249762 RepID=UPI000DE49182|nr:TetR/AcrR family transcriptional regulator [Nonomuraea lactucae]